MEKLKDEQNAHFNNLITNIMPGLFWNDPGSLTGTIVNFYPFWRYNTLLFPLTACHPPLPRPARSIFFHLPQWFDWYFFPTPIHLCVPLTLCLPNYLKKPLAILSSSPLTINNQSTSQAMYLNPSLQPLPKRKEKSYTYRTIFTLDGRPYKCLQAAVWRKLHIW